MAEQKPTFLQLREQYGLNTWDLAEMARVEPDDVYFMFVNQPVSREVAARVLKVVSFRANREYTLENVDVAVLDDEGEDDDATT